MSYDNTDKVSQDLEMQKLNSLVCDIENGIRDDKPEKVYEACKRLGDLVDFIRATAFRAKRRG